MLPVPFCRHKMSAVPSPLKSPAAFARNQTSEAQIVAAQQNQTRGFIASPKAHALEPGFRQDSRGRGRHESLQACGSSRKPDVVSLVNLRYLTNNESNRSAEMSLRTEVHKAALSPVVLVASRGPVDCDLCAKLFVIHKQWHNASRSSILLSTDDAKFEDVANSSFISVVEPRLRTTAISDTPEWGVCVSSEITRSGNARHTLPQLVATWSNPVHVTLLPGAHDSRARRYACMADRSKERRTTGGNPLRADRTAVTRARTFSRRLQWA